MSKAAAKIPETTRAVLQLGIRVGDAYHWLSERRSIVVESTLYGWCNQEQVTLRVPLGCRYVNCIHIDIGGKFGMRAIKPILAEDFEVSFEAGELAIKRK